ncbi:site-specific DNA-methyltransferase [Endozoicomonas sp. ONNA2]|uniref:site-specific DNA-methyltransferase n=1 Tax=Endozoicomonas sp. ONNA2 TaxID=2828741 RepID=UPI002147C365|nr:site-specific DNA-methyltransferase [Endozoicomonas sp. ONNA2]
MIVEASSNPGDIVLDPFCGSGTTIHAARELGRHWIGIDQSFTAANATLTRMRHGLKKMGDYVNQDTSQRNLQLESNAFLTTKDNFIIDKDVYDHYPEEVIELSKV